MDYNQLRRRINRKLGVEVLSDEDISNLWSMAEEFISDYNINFSESGRVRFKVNWIICQVKQIPEYWTESVLENFLSVYGFKLDLRDLRAVGLEDELGLVNRLIRGEKT